MQHILKERQNFLISPERAEITEAPSRCVGEQDKYFV